MSEIDNRKSILFLLDESMEMTRELAEVTVEVESLKAAKELSEAKFNALSACVGALYKAVNELREQSSLPPLVAEYIGSSE